MVPRCSRWAPVPKCMEPVGGLDRERLPELERRPGPNVSRIAPRRSTRPGACGRRPAGRAQQLTARHVGAGGFSLLALTHRDVLVWLNEPAARCAVGACAMGRVHVALQG
jgi:hypothetical protein